MMDGAKPTRREEPSPTVAKVGAEGVATSRKVMGATSRSHPPLRPASGPWRDLHHGHETVDGQNWQWDGPSDTKVDKIVFISSSLVLNLSWKIQVPVSWLNSTIPFKPYLGNSWTYGDCIIIRFNRQV